MSLKKQKLTEKQKNKIYKDSIAWKKFRDSPSYDNWVRDAAMVSKREPWEVYYEANREAILKKKKKRDKKKRKK